MEGHVAHMGVVRNVNRAGRKIQRRRGACSTCESGKKCKQNWFKNPKYGDPCEQIFTTRA
jgi:hypothetical protein